jgi:thiamine pyrophosphokinase
MKNAVLFLPGRYPRPQLPFYRRLCANRFRVAVDGGYRFFRQARITPDLIIGDMDSLGSLPKRLSAKTTVLIYPEEKDRTDSHLALQYCLDEGASDIDIVQPDVGEPDHFLGNLMLLTMPPNSPGKKRRIRLVSFDSEIMLLRNGQHVIKGGAGDLVSMIPLSKRVTYSCRGTRYRAAGLRLRQSDSRTLRNEITADRAVFEIVGEAFLLRQYRRGR